MAGRAMRSASPRAIPAMPSPVQPGSLIFTDPPRHRQMRKLINSGFTRRRVSVLEPKIREIVRGILDGMEPDSVHEFAEEIAGYIPILQRYVETHANKMPLSGRLALECGIQEYRTRLRWARASIALYEEKEDQV